MSQSYILHKGDPNRELVRANLDSFLNRLPDTKSWQVEVKEFRKSRSNAQNNALFGVAYPAICKEAGYDPDELHHAMCCKFFGTARVDVMGVTVTRPMRTTTTDENGKRDVMPAGDFADFYAMVQRIGAEVGIDVPDPDPLRAAA
jgi:hypothetical protein